MTNVSELSFRKTAENIKLMCNQEISAQGVLNTKYFKKLSEATIAEKYNVDEIETRVLNGDGANWIKATCQNQDIHFQLDPFHISQAILRKVKDKKSQKQLIKLFRVGKVDKGL